MIWLSPWRRERIFAYLDPWDEAMPLGKAYQLSHSLIAFGRGEFFGVGLGGSVEKLHYLPEAHTDFLLAVIGEELGLVGVAAVIVLFFWLASARSTSAARRSRSTACSPACSRRASASGSAGRRSSTWASNRRAADQGPDACR